MMMTLVAAGQNKQHTAAKNVAKLDRETEELHHDTVSLDVSRLIQQGRQAKGMTQKELATVSAALSFAIHTQLPNSIVTLSFAEIKVLD